MKTLFNTLVITILVNFVSYSQQYFNQTQSNIIDAFSDSINSINYIDHSELKGDIMSLILSNNYDDILRVIHTDGFKEFIEIDKNSMITSVILSDNAAINIFSKIKSNFPKNTSSKPSIINVLELSFGPLTTESWIFKGLDNHKYELSVYFFNSQIISISYKIFKF
jgi:hypothetical protein